MEQPTHSAYSPTTSPNITQVRSSSNQASRIGTLGLLVEEESDLSFFFFSLFLSDFGTLARSAVLTYNIPPAHASARGHRAVPGFINCRVLCSTVGTQNIDHVLSTAALLGTLRALV